MAEIKELLDECAKIEPAEFKEKYQVGYVQQIPNIIIVENGAIFFADRINQLFTYILLKNGNYYTFHFSRRENITPIVPVGHTDHQGLLLESRSFLRTQCYFIDMPELGNAIYIHNYINSQVQALIYFDEQCNHIPSSYDDMYKIGRQTVKIINNNYGIMVINSEGNLVPYHLMTSYGAVTNSIFENDNMKIEVNKHPSCLPTYYAKFIAKSGQKTKSAPRLTELSTE